ncbi:TIGR03618 family F420-dependent PPOX class oxidoreductase [Saccharopolyspora gloriosae]|uniref:TIGR03618 family F420-dependent PPOX class oxidoreductase n=1 Tax=Saccharopolyspora gloriosae TaxID=455344 RepID=UPI001FB6D785|nr:TIGR03618 family F420-dependent PPOX class oxidoreductase [Saccharopolyspora gloriosae]
MELPEDLLDLLRKPSPCFVATAMPDGAPQLTQTWCDTDGEHVLINMVEGSQKVRNLRRDPRVAVNVTDPEHSARYYALRGRVVDIRHDGAVEHIHELSHRYLGMPYPWFGGEQEEDRLLARISIKKLNYVG